MTMELIHPHGEGYIKDISILNDIKFPKGRLLEDSATTYMFQ